MEEMICINKILPKSKSALPHTELSKVLRGNTVFTDLRYQWGNL